MTRFKTACITTLLLISALSALAWADEPMSEWDQKYKDEPHIMLLIDEAVTVNRDYSTTTRLHTVRKIQKESAKGLGEITFRYDQDREEIAAIEAYTVTPDGKRLKYEKIQDLSSSGDNSVYSDERKKVVTLPGVVVGSVIDAEVTIKRHKPYIENNFFDKFYFSSGYPVREARYSVTAPKDTPLVIKALNASIEPEKSGSDNVTYTWLMRNIDKIDYEEFMPSPEEVHKSVGVSTLKDWKQLSDWEMALFRKGMKITPEMKQKVSELTMDKTALADKVQAVIDYIRQDYRYVSMNMDSHNYEPHPADEVFKNKYGDCKDQTLLAMALLSEIGVKAFPALMSTYSDLHREDLLPMPSYFNHVILVIEFEGKKYYTDVLYKGYRFQELPAAHEGKRALALNDEGGSFTVLPVRDADDRNNTMSEKVTIAEDGSATDEMTVTFSRDLSISMREGIKNIGPDQREKALAAVETGLVSGGRVIRKEWKNIDALYGPISITVLFESSSIVQRMGDMMVFGMLPEQRNALFSSPKRYYPIVFISPVMSERRVTYIIPDGWEMSIIPKKLLLDPGFAVYLREYETQGNQIIGKEIEGFKPGRTPVARYAEVQNFLDEIARKTNDRILIKKK